MSLSLGAPMLLDDPLGESGWRFLGDSKGGVMWRGLGLEEIDCVRSLVLVEVVAVEAVDDGDADADEGTDDAC